jgi:hypothetical protein
MNDQIINNENMKNICEKCYKNPKSHSFKILKSNSNIPVFYTCPGEAEDYSDSDAILLHYNNMLNVYGNKEWIWVFNCDKLEIKHSLEFNTARKVSILISEKYNNIKQIYILNSNFIFNTILNIVWPFLDDKIKDLIISVDKLPFDVTF